MKNALVSVCLVLASAVAWAVPTVQNVQTAVQQGHYTQAEDMMREVVAAKPASAKAHYLYAEILAHNGSFAKASEQAQQARKLDPGITFTQPDKFRAFEQLLEREQNNVQQRANTTGASLAAPAAPAPLLAPSGGIPGWVWLAALGVVGYLLWRGFSRSRVASAPAAASYGSAAASPGYGYGATPMGGYGAGTPGAAMPGASPSGGLLKTGLAVAGGVAAGMMVDEMLHRRQSVGSDQLSGLQHGMFDTPTTDDAAQELERRDVDFGSGGDWDSGASTGDAGGGSGDGGGWD